MATRHGLPLVSRAVPKFALSLRVRQHNASHALNRLREARRSDPVSDSGNPGGRSPPAQHQSWLSACRQSATNTDPSEGTFQNVDRAAGMIVVAVATE
jgi:hypothetical protein